MKRGGGGIIALVVMVAFATCTTTTPPELSKQQYEQTVRTLYAGVQAAFLGTRGAQGSELAARIGSAQSALRQASRELTSIRPPAEVASDNRALADAMNEYADALDTAARAAAAGDRTTLERFQNAGAMHAVQEMAEAAERMKAKGYDLGPIAED